MDNAYRQAALFYEKREGAGAIIQRRRVERYLRSLAWQGKSDAVLKRIWGVLSSLFDFMYRRKIYSFYYLTKYDFQEVFYLYADTRPNLRLIEQNVRLFFGYIEDFLKECAPDSPEALEEMNEALASFFEGGEFSLPERQEYDELYDAVEHADELTEEEADRLNDLLDGIVARMGEYFKAEERERDFRRAMALYAGPFEDASVDNEEDFWYSFWDYFFFDYHTIEDDISPLRYFYEHEKDTLTAGEKYIMRDLMQARFTVFSIDYVEDDFAACTDIFSGEQMELPCPDHIFQDYRKTILYGHLRQRGVMMLNYITAVPATAKLRQRIKDEILRQFEMFRSFQSPEASLSDFFSRHAAAVRHTINILSNFAQLKVVPPTAAALPRPGAGTARILPGESVLESRAKALGFSVYAIHTAKRLYGDYIAEASRTGSEQGAMLAAVLMLIESINGSDFAPARNILRAFRTTREAVADMMRRIGSSLGCVTLDPRYLTEEGFVQTLYMV